MNHGGNVNDNASPSACVLWLLLRRLRAYEPGLARMVHAIVRAPPFNPATATTDAVLTGAGDGVSALAVSPDGLLIAASGFDCCIRVWEDAETSSSSSSRGSRGTVATFKPLPPQCYLFLDIF